MTELAEPFEMSRTAVSNHLRVLELYLQELQAKEKKHDGRRRGNGSTFKVTAVGSSTLSKKSESA